MRIHREGYATLLIGLIFCSCLIGLFYIFIPAWLWLAFTLAIIIMITLLQFFRDPTRKISIHGDDIVLSPADGKIVVIEKVMEDEFFKSERIQVSIFMSPINVHVNRNPISGNVIFNKYHPGKYLVAWNPKSSEENERTTIVYQKGNKQLLMRQIAGAMARRIINYLHDGASVTIGTEMGFIKFGSRVDLFFPPDAAISVKINDVVKGGITPIGVFSN